MPPSLLFDLESIDLTNILFDRTAIQTKIPQRFEMAQLDCIIHYDEATVSVVGYKEITDQEFWIRGHLPERPLMPGVLMLEAAAQLTTFCAKLINPDDERFIGFGGIENCKFRGTVVPGDRLYLIGKLIENRPRRIICQTQGVVNGQMVFQAQVIGMAV